MMTLLITILLESDNLKQQIKTYLQCHIYLCYKRNLYKYCRCVLKNKCKIIVRNFVNKSQGFIENFSSSKN